MDSPSVLPSKSIYCILALMSRVTVTAIHLVGISDMSEKQHRFTVPAIHLVGISDMSEKQHLYTWWIHLTCLKNNIVTVTSIQLVGISDISEKQHSHSDSYTLGGHFWNIWKTTQSLWQLYSWWAFLTWLINNTDSLWQLYTWWAFLTCMKNNIVTVTAIHLVGISDMSEKLHSHSTQQNNLTF